jgi:pimeloyl-ACP methyl ester carboxylesterase
MVLFHGGGSSRLMCPDAAATLAAGVRLITIDRPGYGRSDPKPGLRLLDWADDYEQFSRLLALPPVQSSARRTVGRMRWRARPGSRIA